MNDGQFSSLTRAMIDAAKADGPGAAARAKVWSGVTSAVGGAAAAGAAAGGAGLGAAAGGASAAKMLAMGALLGGTLTVGLAVTMLRVGPAPVPHEEIRPAPASGVMASRVLEADRGRELATAVAEPHDQPVPAALALPRTADPAGKAPAAAAPVPASPAIPTGAPATARRAAVSPSGPFDPLAREAQLVSEARGALGRGDPARALQAVRAARALPSHQLAPEELAVEAQALRALGRSDEANEVDEKLRSRFPESALAR